MTFPLQRPAGWTDSVDPITAPEITNIDANLSSAVDGIGGGRYGPSSALVVAGSGLHVTNCVAHVVTGPYALSGAEASFAYRVDRTTIDPVASPNVTIDTSSDIYIAASAVGVSGAIVGLNINSPVMVAPKDGMTIIVGKYVDAAPYSDIGNLYFFQNSPTSNVGLGYLPGLNSSVVSPQLNPYLWAEFIFNGPTNRWEIFDCNSKFVVP